MSVFWASEEFFAALLPVATRGIAACLAQTAAQGCYITSGHTLEAARWRFEAKKSTRRLRVEPANVQFSANR